MTNLKDYKKAKATIIIDNIITKMSENNGNLNLRGTPIKELPNNLTVVGYLDLRGTEIKELPNNLTVGGNFYLYGTKIKELPDNLTVGGNLNLYGTQIKELPDGLSVGGDLSLSYTSIKELPDNLTVGGNFYLYDTEIKKLPDGLTVGGNFILRGTPIKKLPDALTVGGGLDLSCTSIEKLPDGLSVGGDLDLRGTPIKKLPDNLTVGGNLNLYGTQIKELPDNLTVGGGIIGYEGDTSNVHYLKDGDCVPNQYIYADNILTFVESKKEIKGYTYYKGKIAGRNVISDGIHFAHCTSFKEGVKVLDFKKAKDRCAEQYSNLTLDTVVSTKELITMYRVITGACQQGTEHFVNSLGKKLKDSYTVREAIELTNGQYRARAFEEFFKKE